MQVETFPLRELIEHTIENYGADKFPEGAVDRIFSKVPQGLDGEERYNRIRDEIANDRIKPEYSFMDDCLNPTRFDNEIAQAVIDLCNLVKAQGERITLLERRSGFIGA